MKNKKHQFIFYTKQKFSYQENNEFNIVEDKQNFYKKLEKELIKRIKIRSIISYTIGGILFIALLILAYFINYTEKLADVNISMGWVAIGVIALWLIIYYILGFFFYPAMHFDFHFKNLKNQVKDKCITYASSNYKIFIDKYSSYLGQVDFNIPDAKKPHIKRKNKMVGFLLIEPKKKNLIFNGKIASNIPYFTITLTGAKKICFFPCFALYIDGNKSKIANYDELEIQIEENPNPSISNRRLIIKSPYFNSEFYINSSFNQNFFNFKF